VGDVDYKTGLRGRGHLDKLSTPISGDMIAQVGTISANNDEAIAGLLPKR